MRMGDELDKIEPWSQLTTAWGERHR